jgi:RsiW-degrading membrane proteinase PrsW (M82 family)
LTPVSHGWAAKFVLSTLALLRVWQTPMAEEQGLYERWAAKFVLSTLALLRVWQTPMAEEQGLYERRGLYYLL